MKRRIKIQIREHGMVSGILDIPDDAWCIMVLAHGAGAGMEHPFMEEMAARLASAGIATLRFNFLYMENGGGRPDLPHVAHRVIAAAVERAGEYASKLHIPVVGAGKSFGGRMFSQVMAKPDAPSVAALVFYGFPLHAPGKPGSERAAHLNAIRIPMLFLQGTRDTLAQEDLIRDVVKALRKGTLAIFQDADHSFHVPKKSGKTDDQVHEKMTEKVVTWLRSKLPA